MPYLACARCGSNKFDDARLIFDNIIPLSGKRLCAACGYLGAPIEFKDEKDRKKFEVQLKSKKKHKRATGK